ncbi:MAG: TrmH family RNA methyltransferase [Balneolaceae bacterium]|nr:TrmH family RNA methyltransferase [Balneolaceae bacterium]
MEKRSTRQILKDNLQRTSPLRNRFILWLHDIRSLHNVGAAFRSADAFGIQEILISGYTPRPPRPEITKTAIGAEEHVKWSSVEQIGEKAAELKQNNWKILGLEQTSTSRMIHQYPVHDHNICLVLGNEVTGISDEMLPLLDETVEIPQFGMKHSLNVSVAAGVALYAFFDKFESADS